MWTPDSILDLLNRSDRAVERALVAILDFQTEDEQTSEVTRYQNSVGFSAADAGFMTAWARKVEAGGRLSYGQLAFLRKPVRVGSKVSRIGKYRRQLADIANMKSA